MACFFTPAVLEHGADFDVSDADAAFVVAFDENTQVCVVRRPDGTIGLPGGKLEPGETPGEAVVREAREEGVRLLGSVLHGPIHKARVDGKKVVWYACMRAELSDPCDADAKRGVVPFTSPMCEMEWDELNGRACLKAFGLWQLYYRSGLVRKELLALLTWLSDYVDDPSVVDEFDTLVDALDSAVAGAAIAKMRQDAEGV